MTDFQDLLSDIESQLIDFNSITLAEMDGVKLMDRTDVKFMVPIKRLNGLLLLAKPHYRILEMGNKRIFDYETMYYDTQGLALYHKHQAGHLNRCKVRLRNYLDTGTSFFEVKVKNNKGRTIKTRIRHQSGGAAELGSECGSFVQNHTSLEPENLLPVLWVDYSRLTLVGIHTAERITIDLHLRFKSDEKQKEFPYLVIVEVKQEKESSASVFLNLMQQQGLRKGGISKYCLGILSLFDHVKRNRFKSKVNSLHKIHEQYAIHPVFGHAQFV